MPQAAGMSPEQGAPETYADIERFLKACRQPALLEPGEEHIVLEGDNHAVELRGSRLTIQAWDARRNIVRRVTGIRNRKPGCLELAVELFGKREGRILLVDLARPSALRPERRGARLVFREQFRRFLTRQFAGWRIAELSTEPDLEHSLSPVYPRALVKKGSAAWAALGCPPGGGDAAGALSFGLIWLDYIRRRERRLAVEGLTLFLPSGEARTTCLRLRWLDPDAVRVEVFVYSPEGLEERLDPRDCGNIDTRLEVLSHPGPAAQSGPLEWMDALGGLPQVETVLLAGGAVSFRIRGLEFARASGRGFVFGVDRTTPGGPRDLDEVRRMAAELARLRSPGAADTRNAVYLRNPESWLESQVRANLERLDASLLPAPSYGQVPAFAGGERSVMDLLAAERSGRLAVLEIKASADIHLPMQALDYWMRVAWHAGRGEFSPKGYFPGTPLSRQSPRLFLVAPALEFHPTTETILRCLSPEVDVERIGVAAGWRRELRVMFRLRGASRPD